MKYVTCPQCKVQYPEQRLYNSPHDVPADGKRYTVSCAVCGCQFDVLYRKSWLRRLKTEIRG